MNLQNVRIGFAMTGSHCTIPLVWPVLERLLAAGAKILPIISQAVAQTDTRFGRALEIRSRLKELTGSEAWTELVQVETIGPKGLLDVMAVAPCTGNTLAKLALGISDTAVTMACKAHLRNEGPVVLAVSTNDGLAGNAANIAALMRSKYYYFVPFGQDNPVSKANSLIARMELLPETIAAAMEGRQLQPVLVQGAALEH